MVLGKIIAESGVEENDIIYFPIFSSNALYAYNKRTGLSCKCGNFPNQPEGKYVFRLFRGISQIQGNIIFAPARGNDNISVYNIEKKEFRSIDIKEHILSVATEERKEGFKFSNCITYEDKVYLIGTSYPLILCLDINTLDICIMFDLSKEIGFGACSLFADGTVRNNSLFIPFLQNSAFLQIDMKNKRAEKVVVEGTGTGFSDIVCGNDNDFYMLESYSNRIFHITMTGKLIDVIQIYDLPEKESNRLYFENLQRVKDGFFIFPVRADKIYYYDYKTDRISVCKEFEEITERELGNKRRTSRRLFSFSTRPNYAYLVESGTKIWHEICLTDRSYSSFQVQQAINGIWNGWPRLCYESENCKLSDTLDLLKLVNDYEMRWEG